MRRMSRSIHLASHRQRRLIRLGITRGGVFIPSHDFYSVIVPFVFASVGGEISFCDDDQAIELIDLGYRAIELDGFQDEHSISVSTYLSELVRTGTR